MFRPGERLGAYEIVQPLASGGMATLYRAKRRGAAGFARDVAIKVVHPHLAANGAFLRMFVQEANLAVRIHHPNVVQVEELGVEGGTLYLVMELIRGCSLADLFSGLLERGVRLAPLQAVRLAIQIADGLHAAHEARGDDGSLLGVVHRDVTPQNVLVSEQGYAKLIDFGIAKAMGRDRTRTGTLKGKYAYMTPEQARGAEVDRTTDIYALGIVLWELLTLRPLFDGANDVELLDHARNPHIEPPSKYAADVSPALDAAVLAALARRREDRPPTAEAFRRMLCDALPEAATEGASALAQLLAEVQPRRSEPTLPCDHAIAAAREFRLPPDAVTLPQDVAGVTPAPSRAVSMAARTPAPAAERPRIGMRVALVTTLLLAAIALGLNLRAEEPPAATPGLAVQRPTPAPVVPKEPPAALPALSAPPSALPAPLPTPEPPRARRAPRKLPVTAPRTPATRMIDGVIVLDEAPY